MTPAASSAQRHEAVGASPAVRCGQAAIACAFAIVLICGLLRSGEESVVVSLNDLDNDAVIVSLANIGFPATVRAQTPASGNDVTSALVAGSGDTMRPKLVAAYRSLLKLVAVMDLQRGQDEATRKQATLLGMASTYNPQRAGKDEGGIETASGESYDPAAWTAAIHIDLRDRFGGVRYGRLYQPAYALVENGDKRVIVRINDVGPLKPGRVIDLNERSMRYFDSSLQRGLLSDAKVTLLPGADWTPGPIGGFELMRYARAP